MAVLRDYLQLTKPRICVLALIMAALGFELAAPDTLSFWPLGVISLVGIGLVGASAGVLNQYIERDLDRQMPRTKDRPIPTGRIAPEKALKFGLIMGIAGELILLFGVNLMTAVLGAFTLFFYLGIYTPAKRVNSMSTIVGAIPGAMPPLLGWTAAHGSVSKPGLILFGILFLWQIPHFLAIGWMYREDYGGAKFPILNVVDLEGLHTAKEIVIYSMVLLTFTLVPFFGGMAGKTYFYGALFLGALFLAQSIVLAVMRTRVQARRLFFASLIYLPVLGVLMAWDKV